MPSTTSDYSMRIYENRLNSYLPIIKPKSKAKPAFPHKPTTHPRITPEHLASAGFYHYPDKGKTGVEADTCKCFLCGLSLGGWDEGDDPYEEHANRGGCAWGEVVCRAILDKKRGIRQKYTSKQELPNSSESSKLREQTYKDWPHPAKPGWKPTVKNLAKAGFIFAPTEGALDLVQCPFCDYAVEGWEAKDDPWALHLKKQTSCHFFLAELEGTGPVEVEKPQSKISSKVTKSTASRSKRMTTAAAAAPDSIEVDDEDEDPPASQTQSQSQNANPRTRKPRGTTATTSTTATTTDLPKRKTTRKKIIESDGELEVESQRTAIGLTSEAIPIVQVEDDAKSKSKSKSSRKTVGRKTKAVVDEEAESQVESQVEVEINIPVEKQKDITPRPTKSSRRVTKASIATTTTNTSIPQRPLTQLDGFANIPPSSPLHQPPKPSARPPTVILPTITTKPPSPTLTTPPSEVETGVQIGIAEAGKVMDEIVKREFTEEEKKMTLEELIRFEYKRRYEALKLEGEEMIKRWEERAGESRKLLEAL